MLYDSLLDLNFIYLTSATGARRELLEKEFDGFKKLFGKFIDESGPSVVWDNIEKLPVDAVIACSRLFEDCVTISVLFQISPYASLTQPSDEAALRQMLSQLVVVKLNGGLGTSMGCRSTCHIY